MSPSSCYDRSEAQRAYASGKSDQHSDDQLLYDALWAENEELGKKVFILESEKNGAISYARELRKVIIDREAELAKARQERLDENGNDPALLCEVCKARVKQEAAREIWTEFKSKYGGA